MIRCIKKELERAFCSRKMLIALLAGVCIAVAQVLVEVLPVLGYQDMGTFKTFPHTSFEHYIGLKNGSLFAVYYYTAIGILAAVPYAITAYSDYRNGYIKQIWTRTKKSYYYVAKYTAAFLSAGTVAVLPQIINFMLNALLLPSIQPYPGIGYVGIFADCIWADIYYRNVYIYIFLYWVLDFVVYGAMNMLSVALVWLFHNRFLVLLAPFFFCQALNLFARFSGHYEWMPDSFLKPAQPQIYTSFAEILLVLAFIGVVCVVSSIYGCSKKDYYG